MQKIVNLKKITLAEFSLRGSHTYIYLIIINNINIWMERSVNSNANTLKKCFRNIKSRCCECIMKITWNELQMKMSFSFIPFPVSSVIRVCSSRPAADQDGLVAFANVAASHGWSSLFFLSPLSTNYQSLFFSSLDSLSHYPCFLFS